MDESSSSSTVCSLISQGLSGGAKQLSMASSELRSRDWSESCLRQEAAAVSRHLLGCVSRIDLQGHGDLVESALLSGLPASDSWQFYLSLATRFPSLRGRVIDIGIGWLWPRDSLTSSAADLRQQFSAGHSLLSGLLLAAPAASAEKQLCDQLEAKCLFAKPLRLLGCYLLNLVYAMRYYLSARRSRLLIIISRTVAKLETWIDARQESAMIATDSSVSLTALPAAAAAAAVSGGCQLCRARQLLAEKMALCPGEEFLSEQPSGILTDQVYELITCPTACKPCEPAWKVNFALYLLTLECQRIMIRDNWPTVRALHKDLLSVIDEELSHHTRPSRLHYLLFFTCSFREDLLQGLLDYLWKRVRGGANQRSLEHRVHLLSLLCDLCCRSLCVSQHVLQSVLMLLRDFSRSLAGRRDSLAESQAASVAEAGGERQRLLLAAIEAFARIVVWQRRRLLDDAEDGAAFLAAANFHLVLQSSAAAAAAAAAPGQGQSSLWRRFATVCRTHRLHLLHAAANKIIAHLQSATPKKRRKLDPQLETADSGVDDGDEGDRESDGEDDATATNCRLWRPIRLEASGLSLVLPQLQNLLLLHPPKLEAKAKAKAEEEEEKEEEVGDDAAKVEEQASTKCAEQLFANSETQAAADLLIPGSDFPSLDLALSASRSRKRLLSDCLVFGDC